MGIQLDNMQDCIMAIDAQKNNKSFGQAVELGKEYSVIFRKKNGFPAVAGITGRNVDRDALGISFVRIPDDKLEQVGTTNSFRDSTISAKWATISNLLYKAAKAKEIADARDDAQKAADMAGVPIDELALSQAIEKIELAYEGRRAVDGVAAIQPTKRRLINSVGSKVEINVHSECVVVPLDSNMQPEYDKAVVAGIILRESRLRALSTIAGNPAYNDQNDPNGYMEVRFSCTGTDKKIAMRNPFVGVEKSVRKFNFDKDENGSYVDSHVTAILPKLSSITENAGIMRDRSSSSIWAGTVADLDAAMRKYLAANRVLPLFLDLNDDSVRRHAKTILDLGCVFREHSKQWEELKAIVDADEASANAAVEQEAAVDNAQGAIEATKSQNVGEVVDAIDKHQLADVIGDDVDDI